MFVFPYVATEMHTQTKEYICSGLDNPTIYSTLLFHVMNIQDINDISRCYYHIHFQRKTYKALLGHSLYVNIGILTIVQLNKQQNMVNIRLVPSIQEEYYVSYTHDALFLHHYLLILILR